MNSQSLNEPFKALFLDWRDTFNLMRRYAVAVSSDPIMQCAETRINRDFVPLHIDKGPEHDWVFENHRPSFSPETRYELESLGISSHDLDILVPDGSVRCKRKGVKCSVFGAFRPEESFIRVTQHIYILSPEAAFYRMHFDPFLFFAQRVFLGMELCGSFTPLGNRMRNQIAKIAHEHRSAFDMSPVRVPSTVSRKEVTSTNSILNYLREMDRLRGDAWRGPKHLISAYKTLDCLADHSASPMESLIMCLCCLPKEADGCAFTPARFNVEICLDERSKYINGNGCVRIDIFWPGFGLEYDSDEWHSGISKLRSDATRRLTLTDGSFTLITVTRDQITNNKTSELLLLRIAQNLKEPAPDQSFDATEGRRALRGMLLSDCTEW